ncbi:hypothetical protein [Micromonospora zhanjiangensis]|uniref:Uncharacterized protein n=1 Tax=Micromonospora zhanjiangensis TaxID=1522057 RepID=A0ABV8KMF8_9ACTN
MNEREMRADKDKQARYAELRDHPDLHSAVVAANRAYLAAAVPDAEVMECAHWALTCLPTTRTGRLSAISMKGMETFVLELAAGSGSNVEVHGFVNLRPSSLPAEFASTFPRLELSRDRAYEDGGEDQAQLHGHHEDLIAALNHPAVAAAARQLAQDLLRSGTSYSRFHNYQLADAVLERAG